MKSGRYRQRIINLKFLFIISCLCLSLQLFANSLFEYQGKESQQNVLKRFNLQAEQAKDILPALSNLIPGHGCEEAVNPFLLICRNTSAKLQELKKILRWLDQPKVAFEVDVSVYEVVYNKEDRFDLGFTSLSQGIKYQLNSKVKGTPLPDSRIEWIKQFGQARLLANPSLSLNANEEASIQVGDRVPYIQGEGQGQSVIQTVKFVDTGILLKLKAAAVGKKKVKIDLSAEVSSVKLWKNSANQNLPVISTRKAHTVLTVPYKQEIVLAGLIDQQSSQTIQSTPVLGDLPFIGGLFQKKQEQVWLSDILFVLSPKILK